MRRLLLYFLFSLTLIYCSDIEKSKRMKNDEHNTFSKKDIINNVQKSISKDTLFNYWPIFHDTLRFRKEVLVDKHNGMLFVKKYSLNDSSVMNTSIAGTVPPKILIDFSHASVIDLELFLDTIKTKKRINKESFKNHFQPNDLKTMNLSSIRVDSISNDVINFSSDIGVPDTDILWEIKYSIEIKDKSLDSLKIQKIEYIGL